MKEVIIMINTIKLHQARTLIHHRKVDGLFYVDEVSDGDCPGIIFKSDLNDQLYSFYYYESDLPDLGTTIDTIQQFDAFLNNINNSDLDVEVAPVKKVAKQITVTKYVGDDEEK